MKIRYFLLTAVLATAILGLAGFVNAQTAGSTPSCPTGMTWSANNNLCTGNPVCPTGSTFQVISGQGMCAGNPVCPTGSTFQVISGQGMCAGNPVCPTGSTFQVISGQGMCAGNPVCPTGSTFQVISGQGMCAGGSQPCLQGSQWNSQLNTCVYPPMQFCPVYNNLPGGLNSQWNSQLNTCVYPPMQFCPVYNNLPGGLNSQWNSQLNTCVYPPMQFCPQGSEWSSSLNACTAPASSTPTSTTCNSQGQCVAGGSGTACTADADCQTNPPTDNSALIAQLQAMIQQLMQQIAVMQAAQQGGGTNPTPTPPTSWCHAFNNNLGFANSGSSDVSALHSALQNAGISSGTDAGTTTYNTGTSSALIKFQAKYGIPQTGYFGTQTRAKLNSLYGCGKTPPINQPSITVTSPNGGETWDLGTTQTIQYNISSNMPVAGTCVDSYAVDSNGNKIPLTTGIYIGSGQRSGLSFKLVSDNSNNIFNGAEVVPGTYKIELDAHYCAETNNTFITSGTSNGSINIVAAATTCTTDSDCASGQTCVSGSCTTPPVTTANCDQLKSEITAAYGKSCGVAGYDPLADVNKDGNVGFADLGLFTGNATNDSWCAQQLANTTNPCTPTTYNYPTVTVPSNTSNGLIIGVQQIGAVTAAVSAKGPITLDKITFWLGSSGLGSGFGITNPTLNFNGIPIQGASCVVNGAPGSAYTAVCTAGSGYGSLSSLAAGTSATFGLFATVSGSISGVNPTVYTSLAPAGFIWDDPSASGTSGTGLTGNIIPNFPKNDYTIGTGSPVAQPSITVTSPNGGETWNVGETHNITWNTVGFDSNAKVRISIMYNFTPNAGGTSATWLPVNPEWQNGTGIPNTGNYSWTIPASIIEPGTNTPISIGGSYKIFVDIVGNVNGTSYEGQDYSDNLFTIGSPTTQCSNLYWIDNSNTSCQQKQFCGAYMYAGLQTFSSLTDCQVAVLQKQLKNLATLTINVAPNNLPGTGVVLSANGGPSMNISVNNGPITLQAGTIFSITTNPVSGYTAQTSGTCGIPSSAYTSVSAGANYTCNITYTQNNLTQPSITITSPAGGEQWAQGSTHTITWTSTGLLPTDQLYILAGPSSSPSANVIANNVPLGSQTSYNWTVPSNAAVGSTYKIMTWIQRNGLTVVVQTTYSNAFSVVAATNQISSPNCLNLYNTIYNALTGAASNGVAPTCGNNAGYNAVTDINKDGIINTDDLSFFRGYYNGHTNNEAWCAQQLANTTSPCTITTPSISVTSPSTGGSYQTGSTINITWNSTGFPYGTQAGIILLNNNQFVAQLAGVNTPNQFAPILSAGAFSWTITLPQTSFPTNNSFQIEVVSLGLPLVNGKQVMATSGYFTIAAPSASPVVSLSVNGNSSTGYQSPTVNLGSVSSATITWSAANATYCNTYGLSILKLTDGTLWNTNLPTSGSKVFNMAGQTDLQGNTMYSASIGVQCWNSNNVSDSKGIIVTWSAPAQPSITVTSPNGGETWTQGSTHNITWTSTGITGNISISITSGGGNPYAVATVPMSSSSYPWTIPSNAAVVSTYKVLISGTNSYSGISAYSNYFSVVAPAPVAVNGVCGSANGVSSATAPVANLCSTGTATVVSVNTPWTWTCLGANGGATAYCSAPAPAPVNPTLSVISPMTGASLTVGQTYNITWTYTGVSNTSINLVGNGSIPIATNIPASSGSYSWTVPATTPVGSTYNIQMTDNDSGHTNIVSTTGYVSIVAPACLNGTGPLMPGQTRCAQPAITINSQTGTEQWVMGTSHDITWTSTGVTSLIITLQQGNSGWTLASSVPASSGKYSWTVANVPVGTGYKVNVIAQDGSVVAVSSGTVNIVAASNRVSSIPNEQLIASISDALSKLMQQLQTMLNNQQ